MNAKRVTWIDCAKGIGILLVILSHTVSGGILGALVRALLFSFSMPLFFLLSGITYRYSTSDEELLSKIKKAFRHLIIPIFVVFVIWHIYMLVELPARLTDREFWKLQFLSLFLGSGAEWKFGSFTIPELGIPWFLYALFFSRSIYDYLQLHIPAQQLQIVVWLFSLAGVAFGSSGVFLPFSLDIALAVLPFFSLGIFLKSRKF